MKNLTETITESAEITGLKPEFYFSNMLFFDTLTDPEQQRYITSSYKRKGNKHCVFFFYKHRQIGYLRLNPID